MNSKALTVTRYDTNVGNIVMGKRRILKRDKDTKAFSASNLPPFKTNVTNVARVIYKSDEM